ncbi:electron transfer flavoprotein subunit alpha/FixB family protein [Candidatus Symbiobacter mobilis]|uniref:Electron transfer flavoprotein subunit alpha n=1 Tax=Candidatus Symbiobacter mobilis CR TaxID=946483 RepID=U5N950_9BURK|nr:FAD-binding protein [Candidatus Symbiobacter mobilis]AGX88086.1 electron transfer flavoprotein subunit alpha [Candidatus Symbiobacter mobilis CR]
MTALVLADHAHSRLLPATLHAVTAARQCGGEVHILVCGHQVAPVAREAACVEGVTKVWHVDDASLEHAVAEVVCEQVIALAGGYCHLVFAATASGKNIAPRVAARCGIAQVSDVLRIVDDHTFCRPIYAGSAIETVRTLDDACVLTIRTTSFDAAPTLAEPHAPIEVCAVVAAPCSAMFVGQELVQNTHAELATARVVVSGGRALGSAEQFQALVGKLADKLGAATGASRAAVDAGYAPNDWQVGQTGKIVAPELYIAVGISGAIQHLTGMKDSKVIVAINKDPDAPIFQVADYGLVADLFDAVPRLIDALG